MHERTRNVIVGITAIAGIVGLCVLLVLFGFVPAWLEEGYEIRIRFDNAGGLGEGNRVKFNGIDVGQVTQVQLDMPKPGTAQTGGVPAFGVLVTARIQEVPLPADVTPTIQTQLLGGSPVLALDRAPSAGPVAWLPQDGSAMLEGHTSAGGLAAQFTAALQEPMAQIQTISASFDRLSAAWIQVGDDLHVLLRQPTADEAANGGRPDNLVTTVALVNKRLSEMEGTIAGMHRWVNDEEFRADVAATAENTRQVTEDLKGTVGRFNALADSSQADFERLSRRYIAVADDLSAAIGALRQTLEQARTGKGTVGKLINDPALYNNINDTFERINKTMVELDLLVQKWKAEGLNVRF